MIAEYVYDDASKRILKLSTRRLQVLLVKDEYRAFQVFESPASFTLPLKTITISG